MKSSSSRTAAQLIPSVTAGNALRCFGLLGLLVAGACTFYTGTPNGVVSSSAGASSGGSGSGASGGRADSGGDASTADGGAAGDTPVIAPWTDATGTLTGMTVSDGGAVVYMSAKPDEDKLIVGLSGFGLWSTADGGKHWTGLGQSGASDLIDNIPTAVIYDPSAPDTFWEAGIYGGGVFRTDDDGKTFSLLGGIKHIDLVSIDFTDKARKTMVAGPHELSNTFSTSTDAGQSWTLLKDNLPANGGFSSYPVVIDSQHILMGCTNMIARSTDGGATWTKVSTVGGYKRPLRASDGSIYWGSDGDVAVMRSTDEGATWTRIVAANVLNTISLLELPDHRIAALSANYVLVSDDLGSTWKTASAQLPFKPAGLVYSVQQKAFYIWINSPAKIPAKSIMRYEWDYTAN